MSSPLFRRDSLPPGFISATLRWCCCLPSIWYGTGLWCGCSRSVEFLQSYKYPVLHPEMQVWRHEESGHKWSSFLQLFRQGCQHMGRRRAFQSGAEWSVAGKRTVVSWAAQALNGFVVDRLESEVNVVSICGSLWALAWLFFLVWRTWDVCPNA